MATYTASTYFLQPKSPIPGAAGLRMEYMSGNVAHAVGDVVLLARMPPRVEILSVAARGEVPADTGVVGWRLFITPGNPSSATSTIAELRSVPLSISTASIFINSSWNLPTYSISSDDAYQYSELKMRLASGSVTASLSLVISIVYNTK